MAESIEVIDLRCSQNLQSQLSRLMSDYQTQTESQNHYKTYASELKALLTIQKQIIDIEKKIRNSKMPSPDTQAELKNLLVSKQAVIQLSTVLKKTMC